MDPHHRTAALWTATHDNGWMTGAVERPDGTFAAWAAPAADAGPITADYIEDSPENAMRAADFALQRKTGHDRCSASCTGWGSPHRPAADE